ncbi:MAG: response regulator [Bacillota bacterium]|nr:response regulator [Bacillota bacterium]
MRKILLAEDEEILRMLIIDTFEEKDYQVDEAENGRAALELFQQNQYDLIILDYMMPVLTGLEFIEKINKDKQNTKILMLSAKSQQVEQEKVLKAGADYFMSKPFSPSQLLEKVEEILHGQ